MQLSFHGGAGTVTGSRYLLRVGDEQTLVDAGMFQGLKALRELNWRAPAFDPKAVDHLLLTHTHIDHAGYLPRLVSQGYRGKVYCTPATQELAAILLRDAAKLQEEDARYANKKGYSKHEVAVPLFNNRDVTQTLKLFQPVPYEHWLELSSQVRARFHDAGHILGSAMIEVETREASGPPLRLIFSGDVGRYGMPLHPDPHDLPECDVLTIESTYGNREHDTVTFEEQVVEPFRRTFERGGVVLIPSFAVGRSQQVTLILRNLMEAGKLPEVPIHIDSPMAVNATEVYSKYCDEHRLGACVSEKGESLLFPRNVHFHRTVVESKRLNAMTGPRVIISGSGMLTGGRILHHLTQRMPDPENLLCLVGYQAPGTRGRRLLEGARTIRMHGYDVPVHARFMTIHGLSGHADRGELLRWVKSAPTPPKWIFVTHGEPESSTALGALLASELGAKTFTPRLASVYELDPIRGPQIVDAGVDVESLLGQNGPRREAAAPSGGTDTRSNRANKTALPQAGRAIQSGVPSGRGKSNSRKGRAVAAPAASRAPARVPAPASTSPSTSASASASASTGLSSRSLAPRQQRKQPLPQVTPHLPPGDPGAAERIREILQSAAYRRADQDLDFIGSADLRHVRLLLDYQKPEQELARHHVESTIVVFGGTRIVEPKVAEDRLRVLRSRLGKERGNRGLQNQIAVAKRVLAKSRYYDVARGFASLVSKRSQKPDSCRLVIVTGGGPGIMEASNRGAFDEGAKSIGLNIMLPMEQYPNSYITPGLCFVFRYFALRKMHFLNRAKALVAFPGGYGTFDELFETLTLIQTQTLDPIPVVLVGKQFWKGAFNARFLADEGVIDPEDVDLITYAETAEEIWSAVRSWYEARKLDLYAPAPTDRF